LFIQCFIQNIFLQGEKKDSHFNLGTAFHSKLFHGRWEKGEWDKKIDFYKIRILGCELFFFSFQISYFNMPYTKLRGNTIGRPENAWETQSTKKRTLKNMVLNWTLLTPLMITKEQLQWWTKTLLFWEFGYLDVKGTFCVLPNCCSNEINLLCNHLHAFLIQNLIIYLKKLKNLIS
jgi:hypothetical protein